MTDLTDLFKNNSIIFEIDVKDLDRAKKFYIEKFGLEVMWDGGNEVGWCQMKLPVPGTSLGLNLLREGEVTKGSGMLYFDTADLDAVEKLLKEKGVETKPIHDIPDMVSILVAIDPDGNEIGIVAEPRVKSE